MAAYCRVYESRHMQADCQEPASALEPTLGNQYGLPFLFFVSIQQHIVAKPPRDVGAGAVAVMC